MYARFFFLALSGTSLAQLDALPQGYKATQWSWWSNQDPLLAAIPGQFNRTTWDAPSAANVSDARLQAMYVDIVVTPKASG
jgi:hypothetical protein